MTTRTHHARRPIPSIVFIAAWLLLPGALAAQPAPAGQTLDTVIKSVKDRFAPDRRVTVFDVTAERAASGVVVKGDVESPEARDAVIQALTAAGFGPVTGTVTVLPDPALGAARFGIVRVSVANVKSKPSHMSDMASQTVMGWTVRVLRKASGWCYVHTEPDGYLGWIEELQLALVDQAGLDAWRAAQRAVVIVPATLVHEQPAIESIPVADAVAGALLRVTGAKDGWTAVALADGRQGFVPAAQVQAFDAWTSTRQPTPDNIERTAQRFMGVPYLWGGTSAKGFDCSGYTKTVLHLNGIELPRDADQQALQGTAVAIDDTMSQARKGDLLFFGSAATADRPERVTHVGIYVGNGEFLHASGLVRRNSLLPGSPIFSESLRARLLHVRRVLP